MEERGNKGGEVCENKERLRIAGTPPGEKTEREPVGGRCSNRIKMKGWIEGAR